MTPPNNSPDRDNRSSSLRIMIVAGEASGDKHGAALATALREQNQNTNVELFGAGGDEMRAAGVDTIVDIHQLAFIGVVEVTAALPRFYRAYRRLLNAARVRRADAVVLIDWPDFNMTLARKLHREAFKIVYYISPQVWAWRTHRVRALRRDINKMLVILPFEEEFYRQKGVRVEYVGHPLAMTVRATATRDAFAASHGLDPARSIISLLPGSRRNEIRYHLQAMIEAASILRTEQGSTGVQFVAPLASTVDRSQVDAIMSRTTGSGSVSLIERDTYNCLAHSEIAVVASGTATVEAALLGTPMVIVYRASEINWRLIRPLIHLDTFGMVNLIAGRKIVPELMQREVTGPRIAAEVKSILSDKTRLEQMSDDLADARERLRAGGGSGAERAARAVIDVIRGT